MWLTKFDFLFNIVCVKGFQLLLQHHSLVIHNPTSNSSSHIIPLFFCVCLQVSETDAKTIELLRNPAGLERVTSHLSLQVRPNHFQNGVMNITCLARLTNLYIRTAKVVILQPSSRWFASTNFYHTSGQSTLFQDHRP